jgi:hypothetical protein
MLNEGFVIKVLSYSWFLVLDTIIRTEKVMHAMLAFAEMKEKL